MYHFALDSLPAPSPWTSMHPLSRTPPFSPTHRHRPLSTHTPIPQSCPVEESQAVSHTQGVESQPALGSLATHPGDGLCLPEKRRPLPKHHPVTIPGSPGASSAQRAPHFHLYRTKASSVPCPFMSALWTKKTGLPVKQNLSAFSLIKILFI